MVQYYRSDDPSLPTLEQAGGKGLSLLHLGSKGFPVPPAVVLPTRFFQPWLEELKAAPQWLAFARAGDGEMAPAAWAVKEFGLTLAFTGDQQGVLAQVRECLRVEGVTLMAVRSSSPEEDLEGASFAGIYETVLGVTAGGLEEAIRTCFASALDERVVAYKQKRGFDPLHPKIAVVVQEQIASEVSGVAFSLNPVSNCYDECVINANYGLGQTVVDGTVTPDQAVVDKVSNTILSRTAGEKEVAVYLRLVGGTESRAPESPSSFCLTGHQILAIASLAARVETEYGKPVDIEWAYEGGRLYLLQARPITTYYRLPDEMITPPGEQKHLYHDVNLTEQGLPENMSPLGEGIFIHGSQVMMGADASVVSFDRGFMFGCAGRTYTNVGRMCKLMGKGNTIRTFRLVDDYGTRILDSMDLKEYIPKRLPKGLVAGFIKTALVGVRMFLKSLRVNRDPDGYLQVYLEAQEQAGLRLKSGFEAGRTFEECYRLAMVEVGRFMEVSLPSLIAAERARGSIKRLLKGEPESIQERIPQIEQALPNNVTIEMGLVLHELSELPDLQACATPEEFVQKLEANGLSPEFMEQWQHFIEHYGFRCPKEADVATSRYYERPGEVFALLKTIGTHDNPGQTPRSIFERAAKQRVESVRFLEEYLATKGRRKVQAFGKNYKLLENFAGLRETPKYVMIIGVDHIRRRALALGERWVAAGRLDSADQVFDLEVDDISRAESDPSLDIRAVAAANRTYYAQFNPRNDPPVLIDSRGRIPTLPPRPLEENELMGTPVSPGLVTGPVRVLTRVDEKPVLPGEILVTRATDPGWAPLFLNARGVLLESGGTLQHGASVARELGKPCIVAIEGVTKTLADGQMVEMDGATGIVRILE
jgi:pyruvate,water dikinase